MQSLHNLEESLRETACLGDVDKIGVLIRAGVDVNSQNTVNGWTALHWGAKRNHKYVVSHLLQSGADPTIRSFQNELAADVTQSEEIRVLLLGEDSNSPKDAAGSSSVESKGPAEDNTKTTFVPNYLQNPEFPYSESATEFAVRLGIRNSRLARQNGSAMLDSDQSVRHDKSQLPAGNIEVAAADGGASCAEGATDEPCLVIKCRVADAGETDFIEVELDRKRLSFEALVEICMAELNVERTKLKKIRKLPNTIVRNDRDVTRLVQFQEIEIVLN